MVLRESPGRDSGQTWAERGSPEGASARNRVRGFIARRCVLCRGRRTNRPPPRLTGFYSRRRPIKSAVGPPGRALPPDPRWPDSARYNSKSLAADRDPTSVFCWFCRDLQESMRNRSLGDSHAPSATSVPPLAAPRRGLPHLLIRIAGSDVLDSVTPCGRSGSTNN
jgi:hypothetical protein